MARAACSDGGVGECLWEVPQLLARGRVRLLGEQAERPGQPQALLELVDGLVDGPGGGEGLGEPERAGQERALPAAQAVAARRVPVEQRPAGRQVMAHGLDGGRHTR